jgi:hypothetical protein
LTKLKKKKKKKNRKMVKWRGRRKSKEEIWEDAKKATEI